MASDSFLGTLNEFIRITKEIIKKLEEELDWIKGHHERCIAAKTVGTAASVTGAAVVAGSLLLAPITGGASIVAATGYGALAAAAGGGINLVTDLTDMITQRIEKSQIEDICARRNHVASVLKEHFEELERVAGELKTLKVGEEEAYLLSLINTIKKGNRIRATATDVIKLSRCVQVASGSYNMVLRNGGYFWKGMRLQSETLMKSLAFFGFNVSKTGAMAVIRSGTMLLNGAFAIYDVYSLIQCVKNNHPTADAISEIIKQMKEELAEMKSLRNTARDITKGTNMKTASFSCPHCSGLNVWECPDYKEGSVVTCPHDDCKKKYNQVNCAHCLRSIFWKDANYTEGDVVTCPYDDCKKTFNQVSCPHCFGPIVWKEAKYRQGTVVNCPYDNCKNTFNQVSCAHCSRSMVWEEADYKEGTIVTCVYDDCKKKFNQVSCRHCFRSLVWKEANYKKGTKITCPYGDCKKTFTAS